MVHRGTRSKAAQDRRAERGILHCKEEPYQVSSVKLLERSEINALSHGYSGADCRGNETQCRDRLQSWQASWRRNATVVQASTELAQVLDRWTTQQAQQPVARLVDTRGIGRPSNFGSGEGKELGEVLPSVAEEDAELHPQCIPQIFGNRSSGRR